MPFPTGWNRKVEVVVQAAQVPSDQTDFPVLLSEANLPSELFDSDGDNPAQNGGGDIRVTSDAAGDTQLPLEVVGFVTDPDPDNGTAELWVKRTISGSSGTSIYVWYNTTASDTQPAADNEFGSENVWESAHKLTMHLEEDPSGSAPQMIDSTSNDNDGTSNGSMTSGDSVAGKVGDALDFDGTDDYIDAGVADVGNYTADFTVSAWFSSTMIGTEDDRGQIVGQGGWKSTTPGFRIALDSGQIWFAFADSDSRVTHILDSGLNDGSNHLVTVVFKPGGTTELFVDGSSVGTLDTSSETDGTGSGDPLSIGMLARTDEPEAQPFNDLLDEVRISNVARSADYITADFNCTNSPGTFVVPGTPEAATTPAATKGWATPPRLGGWTTRPRVDGWETGSRAGGWTTVPR